MNKSLFNTGDKMLLVKPTIKCSYGCDYCYDKPIREQEIIEEEKEYDKEKLMDTVEEEHEGEEQVILHGGEPLELPKEDVEYILRRSNEIAGGCSLQTNGYNIDSEFIDMFKKYNASVGVSTDGPGELSKYRNEEKTRQTIDNLYKLRANDIPASAIIVVSEANAGTEERLNKLKDWLIDLDDLQIHGRLNPVYGDDYACDIDRLVEVYDDLADFCISNGLNWSPFSDIIDSLTGKHNKAVCKFKRCDYYNTPSAKTIYGNGQVTSCMRTNAEFFHLRKEPRNLDIRPHILRKTDCKGCDYWEYCYGGCPSNPDDWRKKTTLCPVWKNLFEKFEDMISVIGPELLGSDE